jgi:hypothetical protein
MVVDEYLPRASVWTILAVVPFLIFIYVRENDRKLSAIPPEALRPSPVRFTEDAIHEAAERVERLGSVHPILSYLPPATGRRYVVVGGVSTLYFFVCDIFSSFW